MVVCIYLKGSREVSSSSKILATLFGPIPYATKQENKSDWSHPCVTTQWINIKAYKELGSMDAR
jgi:hypothetical protein